MIYINYSFHNGFFSIVFLTEVPHHACALNIPICPTSTTMGSPGTFPGTLHCFRQFPGTPGEANESAPVRQNQSEPETVFFTEESYFRRALTSIENKSNLKAWRTTECHNNVAQTHDRCVCWNYRCTHMLRLIGANSET